MSNFSKKILYLDCMEQGEKVKNAGFVRVQCYEEKWKLDMQISGLSPALSIKSKVVAILPQGKEYPIGDITISGGKGSLSKIVETAALSQLSGGDGVIEKLMVVLPEEKIVEGKFPQSMTGETKERPLTAASQGKKLKSVKPAEEKKIEVNEIKSVKQSEAIGNNIEKNVEPDIGMQQVILNDKWKQLMHLYPVIHPYEDDREYISIHPKDFVIMTGDYQHMANNSFLLHGYYNYRHVILGKERAGESKDEIFYLGVPGVYYEREKMVALMFGFEAFECPGGIAEAAKFGYYLRKVQI